ncbi:MAG: RNA polymerase sigma factor [Patescibacteria group bacterium]|jgi:RNA polymerase sigma-70 factor (ECF subfamily)
MLEKIKEKLLFTRLARKNKAAFDEFYVLYADRMYQYIYYKVNSKEDAEDLTSAFFLKIWGLAREGKIDEAKTFKPFLYTVARNIVIDHYRKRNQRETISLDLHAGREMETEKATVKDFIADEKIDLPAGADKIFEIDRIREKLFELKDEYREVIVLKYLDELEPKEIAAILGKSKGSVNVLAHRAVKALRELVEKSDQLKITN